jgi:DNA-binding MarR family transcriptional regulator
VPDEGAAPAIDYGELPGYVGYQVRRTQARLFTDLEAALKAFDLTPGSFGVLTLIHANPGITQGALAAAFGVDKSTMSPVIVRLERPGLVRREVLASDRRRQALFLADTAEATYRAARANVRAAEESIAARLTAAEQGELGRLLAKLRGRTQHRSAGTAATRMGIAARCGCALSPTSWQRL